MWIKKVTSNLYTQILFSVVLAGIISILLWRGLDVAKDAYINNNHQQQRVQEKKYLDELAVKLQAFIDKYDLTIQQTFETKEVIQMLREFEPILLDFNGNKIYTNDWHAEIDVMGRKSFMYPVYRLEYKDGSALIIFEPMRDLWYVEAYEISIVFLALTMFGLITFFLLRRQFKYIEKIDDGIDILAGGELNYKIPIIGENQLAHLASSINEMSQSLQEKMEREKELDKRQRELITNISHDIRTPLTIVLGYLDILKNNNFKTKEEALEYLNVAIDKSQHLQQLIEELFKTNDNESDKVKK